MRVNIVLADDHQMFRDGLKRLLDDDADFEVVGEADNGREAVRLVKETSPDVVVMDARMPDLNGVDATRQITAANPGTKVICLSAHGDARTASDMLAAGACGYVLKESAFDELTTAIRFVISNKVYLSSSIAGLVVGDYVRSRSSDVAAAITQKMSGREREVLQLISEGKSTKEVAMHLHLSVKTVETHRRNLMQKLNVDSVAELTKYAVREGITSL